MKDNFSRYTMRINKVLLSKLNYISAYEGRSTNKQLERVVKKFIADFESEHGEITEELIQELYRNEF